MIVKTFQKYLIKLFLKKLLIISLIFSALIFILSVFDEISFFKNREVNFFFPYLITILNAPSTLYEIFPFIFLISTQFFFLNLIQKGELEVLKINGLDNLKVIKLLIMISFIIGLLIISFYYVFSSKMKFLYLDLKNSYSNDNKYLAVVTENGLWIKDEIDEKIYIISAQKIEDNYLKGVTISEFSSDFNLIQIYLSDSVDVSNMEWIILKPSLSKDNRNIRLKENIKIQTHFDIKKINGIFRNLSSLSILELINLKKDYKSLGYATNEVEIHLNKLFSFPFYLSIMTVISSIVMLNTKRNKTFIYHVTMGIFLSVLIYYLYYLFNLLGQNGKIPLLLSVWFPLFVLSTLITIGLIRINEK